MNVRPDLYWLRKIITADIQTYAILALQAESPSVAACKLGAPSAFLSMREIGTHCRR